MPLHSQNSCIFYLCAFLLFCNPIKSYYFKVPEARITRSQNLSLVEWSEGIVSVMSLPDVMQATDYTCGPASVLSYVTYYQPDN